MFKKFTSKLIAVLLLFVVTNGYSFTPACNGKFINPISDICWECLFPLKVASIPFIPSPLGLPDTESSHFPLCACGVPIPRIGITLEYWEPNTLVDVTRAPFCMVNLGMEFPIGFKMDQFGGVTSNSMSTSGDTTSFNHVHWYKFPLVSWLDIIASAACVDVSGFDLAYMSELDPTWDDDSLSFILNPEAILFSNSAAQLACTPESAATATGFVLPFDSLFWCAGGQGSMYPISGTSQSSYSAPNNAVLMTERMNFKLHRLGIIPESGPTNAAMCYMVYSPVLPKSRYRYQFTYPTTATRCSPYGTTTFLREGSMSTISNADNYGLLNWRKRNCCFL